MLRANLKLSIKGNLNLDKQTTFALYSSLTLTAKEAQTGVRKAIRSAFTVRTDWDVRGPLAIKIQPATKQKLFTLVGTGFEELEKFVREKPGSIVLKLPRGEFIAIPTTNVRRTKRDLIRAAQRPKALRGKRDVVLPMKSGKGMVLFQRKGAKGDLVPLYLLVPRARIREKDVLFGPTRTVFEKRFAAILAQQMIKAFAPR
jgi:hypothetical protein